MMKRALLAFAISTPLLLGACSSSDATDIAGNPDPALVERANAIGAAVDSWGAAATLPEAKAAAEAALNLVVGPSGPSYGDLDGDGVVQGMSDTGLLPGLMGEEGLAQSPPIDACVEADVLGGSWDDPGARWDAAAAVYGAWTPSNNTMPTLASHPQRIVGWATLTLATDSLDEAHAYAGYAQIHVDVSLSAIEGCSR